ncbi:riboflavin biosynthesis protein VVA0006-like [Ostrea edulis]|nr:riboflavin biosynthesis protein VVA0006-like [Ostrea edulis]
MCTNCWGEHWRSQCTKTKRCRICLQEGHDPGSELCDAFVENQKEVMSFAGSENPLSNFFPCSLHVFGVHHQSSEHAFQYVKAIRNGDIQKAQAIQDVNSALEAKKLGKEIHSSDEFLSKREEVMEEILKAKYNQVEEYHAVLKKSTPSTIYAEAVYDDFWGTGLNRIGTDHTDHNKWPGKNIMGKLTHKIACENRPPSRSISVPRNTQLSDQRNISDMLSSIQKNDAKKPRTGRNSRNRNT